MKKLRSFLSLLLVGIFLLTPLPAYADSPGTAALPRMDTLFDGRNDSPYLNQYRENYALDCVEPGTLSAKEQFENAINSLANVLFQVQLNTGYLLVAIFYYSFEIDIYQIFSPLLTSFVTEMKTSLFDELSLIAISLLGLYFVIKLIQNQRTQVWVAILQTAIIVAFSMFFFTQPLKLLKGVDSGSKEIARQVLTGTFKATNEGRAPDSAVVAAANNIWQIFVHQPWQMLEFGNVSVAKTQEQRILSMPIGSDERKAYIKEMAKDKKYFTTDWGMKRLGLILLYFIPLLIMFIVIALMCLLMLAYQFLTVLYCMMGVFIFILALIPFFGIQLIQNWFMKIIGAGSIKIVVCFCVSFLLSCVSVLFGTTESYGWFITLLLEVTVIVTIVWKKDELFEMFTALRLAPTNAKALQSKMMRDVNVEQKIHEYASNRRMKKDGTGGGYSSGHGSHGGGSSSGSGGGGGGGSSGGGGSGGGGSSPGNSYDPSGQQPASPPVPPNNDSLRNLMKKAEEILDKMYAVSRADSEERARITGKPPEYTEFVEKVDTREKLGAPRFEQREIQAVADEIQRILKAGGNPEEIITQGRARQREAERPASVMEIVNEPQQLQPAEEKTPPVDYEKLNEEYTNEFNTLYGRTYDTSFMQGLTRKYGHGNVRQVMDSMVKRQEREGQISNPAGYLTQSLKNRAKEQAHYREKIEASQRQEAEGAASEDTAVNGVASGGTVVEEAAVDDTKE